MLMGSSIDPFDSQETKPYKSDPEIVAMTSLVGAYQRREVHEAERILRDNSKTILEDAFIRQHIDELLKGLRTQYLIDLIGPYTRIDLGFLSRQLNVSARQVEELLMALILDGVVQGSIDHVNQRLELHAGGAAKSQGKGKGGAAARYAALDKWCGEIGRLGRTIEEKHARGLGAERQAMGMPMVGGMGMSM